MRIASEVTLIALVAAAAWGDLRTRHIPNWIPLGGALLGFVIQMWQSGLYGALTCVAGAAFGLGLFLPLYLLGGMGAGDVKLFGAVGALVGPQALVLVFVLTGLLGGVAAAVLAASKGRLRETLQRTATLMSNMGRMRWQRVLAETTETGSQALRLPYGAVIAGGTLLFLIVR